MRNITKQIKKAFEAGTSTKVSNTVTSGSDVWLFGNHIARTRLGRVQFTLAGWNTPTTRERLQAVGAKVRSCDNQAIHVTADGDIPIDNDKWYDVNPNN